MDVYDVGVLGVADWPLLSEGILAFFGRLSVVMYLSAGVAGVFIMAEYTNLRSVSEPWQTLMNLIAGVVAVLYIGYASYRLILLVFGSIPFL